MSTAIMVNKGISSDTATGDTAAGNAAIGDMAAGRIVRIGTLSSETSVLIVIPARNETRRIGTCLAALAASLREAGCQALTVIVANNCTDATVDTAKSACMANGMTAVIIDTVLSSLEGVGTARALGLSLGTKLAPMANFLLSTDADCEVAPSWVGASIRTLAHFDMVCGRVEPLPEEACALPRSIHEPGALEHCYLQLLLQTESLIDPDPGNPWPHHGRASGANQAFRRHAYLGSGGYAAVLCNEDQEIAQRLRRQGMTVRFSDKPVVFASCRLQGRAPDGMADALSRRIADPDSMADTLLEPAQTHLLRVQLRVQARQYLAAGNNLSRLSGATGIDAGTLSKLTGTLDQQWSWIERHAVPLRRHRLRPSQLPGQIALLETALDQLIAPDTRLDLNTGLTARRQQLPTQVQSLPDMA